MGTDNLFHTRKAKDARELRRRSAKRSSYDKVLIVCEGEKTEPNYFNELIQHYKLNTANVGVDGTCGSSPISVFKRASDLYHLEAGKGDPYDRVYCVFDKDSHESYDLAVDKVAKFLPKQIFYVAKSVPCFEYWLILHFTFTTSPYAPTGTSSIANQVLRHLKTVMPDYEKGCENIFSKIAGDIEFAKENSARALQQAEKVFTDNPSTNIHELVDYLQNLKS